MRSNASRRADSTVAEPVTICIPSETLVPQARASWPFTSTQHVSQVWIGPSCGVVANLGNLSPSLIDDVD
jgi:hypothetical protein